MQSQTHINSSEESTKPTGTPRLTNYFQEMSQKFLFKCRQCVQQHWVVRDRVRGEGRGGPSGQPAATGLTSRQKGARFLCSFSKTASLSQAGANP